MQQRYLPPLHSSPPATNSDTNNTEEGTGTGQYIQVASKTLYVVILKHTTCIIKKFECQCLLYLCPSSVFQRHNIHAVGAIKQTLLDSQNTRQRSSRRLSNPTITSMPFCLVGSYSLLASTGSKADLPNPRVTHG